MSESAGRGVGMVAGDVIHPNYAGYRAWAHHIAESVAPVLLGDAAALCEEGEGSERTSEPPKTHEE